MATSKLTGLMKELKLGETGRGWEVSASRCAGSSCSEAESGSGIG